MSDVPSVSRILLLGGEHYHRSVGDIAMLQVAVERLRLAFPHADVSVVTASPLRLGQQVAGVRPVMLGSGRRRALRSAEYAVGRFAPDVVARAVLAAPGAARSAMRALRRLRHASSEPSAPSETESTVASDFDTGSSAEDVDDGLVALVSSAGLLVLYGGGYLADADPHKAELAFRAIVLARDAGVPCVLSSQGVGPILDPSLLAAARAALPGALAIGTREERLSRETLLDCGVQQDAITFAGDDALLLVTAGGSVWSGDPWMVGVSYRHAAYLGLTQADVAAVHAGVRAWLPSGVRWLPLVTSTYGDEDLAGFRATVVDAHDPLPAPKPQPAEVIRAIAGCALVVSSTYHAALFAASNAIPTLAFGGSDYGLAKLHGIRDSFGAICSVVDVRDGLNAEGIAKALDEATRPDNRDAAHDVRLALQQSVRRFYLDLPARVAAFGRS